MIFLQFSFLEKKGEMIDYEYKVKYYHLNIEILSLCYSLFLCYQENIENNE